VQPDFAEALSNRGLTLKELKRFEEALASYDRALEVRPDYAEAHWNEALLRLLTGDFSRGWVKYEWRWKTEAQAGSKRNFSHRFGLALMRLMAKPSCFIASRDWAIRSNSAAMCHSSPHAVRA
jgi:tetratricopeptide (TPR) repeat protein